jgi:outer membrane protein assembly factor BamA
LVFNSGHIFAGVGVPFGNSEILPFEKRYFIGGANSIRAGRFGESGRENIKIQVEFLFYVQAK